MANQGFLAQSKPAAAANTLLYAAPIDQSASTVLNVANDGTGSNYSVAVKPFDQKLTVDASTYLLHPGDVISGYSVTVDTPFVADAGFSGGLTIPSTDGEKSFKFESIITPDFVEIFVKSLSLRAITIESLNGVIEVGESISKGTAPDDTTAVVYGVTSSLVWVGPSTINGGGTEFGEGDGIQTTGGASATISIGGIAAAKGKFVFSTTTVGGIYDMFLPSASNYLPLFADRAYRFNVSDSSMSGHLFQISANINGEWGPDGLAPSDPLDAGDGGTEYTTGKTVNGTAGSPGAYVEYDLSANLGLSSLYYWYNGDLTVAANKSYGEDGEEYIITTDSPTFTEFYVYDIEGTWVDSVDSFLLGGTTYTVTAQTSGPYGYVRDYTGTTLTVIKGNNSADFTGSDTFLDSPKDSSATRSTVTVSGVVTDTTEVDDEHYLINGKTNSANNVDRTTSLVIGPGERVIIYSATQNNTFSLIGFEDSSTSFTTRVYS